MANFWKSKASAYLIEENRTSHSLMAEARKIQVPDSVVDAIRDQFESSVPDAPVNGTVEPMVRQPRIER
ncbi:MAG: hypothetical protein AAGB04_20035, partial [Pseudomonadota bacterium]